MVYVPPVDSVIFPSDNVEKHLQGKHDQSTHSHRGASGLAVEASKESSSNAMKLPTSGDISENNLVSDTFPFVGLSEKAQGIAASISNIKSTENNPASIFASVDGSPETIRTATYTDRDGVEHYMKIYEAPSADGTGVKGMAMTFDTREHLDASSSVDNKTSLFYADGFEGILEYGADFRRPIITDGGLNASKIYQAGSTGKGVATAMLEFARATSPVPVFHSGHLTDDGGEFAATTKSVQKHLAGKHDQSEHAGGRGKGAKTVVGEKLTRSVLDNVKENGGLSVRLTNGSQPTSGFMVSRKGFGAIHPAKDFFNPEKGKQILSDYLKKNKQHLSTGKDYLGVWHNKKNGMVYLDVSMKIADRQTAINSGVKNDQISIWDVVNFEEIETGGTGNV